MIGPLHLLAALGWLILFGITKQPELLIISQMFVISGGICITIAKARGAA